MFSSATAIELRMAAVHKAGVGHSGMMIAVSNATSTILIPMTGVARETSPTLSARTVLTCPETKSRATSAGCQRWSKPGNLPPRSSSGWNATAAVQLQARIVCHVSPPDSPTRLRKRAAKT
ncbi:hypothetical protein AYO47_00765 [Planctomyces sp. SCGC AG-212-M04]|nr:hypothetical protein AYO47_00765 [Planctomyces sp. SCGC AG-212-M04]